MTNIDKATALALLHEGLCAIPTAGGAAKRPLREWKECQGRLPDEGEVERWFATPRPGGVVCGLVSGDLDEPFKPVILRRAAR